MTRSDYYKQYKEQNRDRLRIYKQEWMKKHRTPRTFRVPKSEWARKSDNIPHFNIKLSENIVKKPFNIQICHCGGKYVPTITSPDQCLFCHWGKPYPSTNYPLQNEIR